MDARLIDVDEHTEGSFLRCLHDEQDVDGSMADARDPRSVAVRRMWRKRHADKGLREKVLLLNDGRPAGLCHYIPIEHSPFLGRELMAILCIWVHGYEHLVGNRQGKGYGRAILAAIEDDARLSGMKGVAAWGKDFPYWNPVSFYEHNGYVRCDVAGKDVLVWKAFDASAVAPEMPRLKLPVSDRKDKVEVRLLLSGWCMGGCALAATVRRAIEGLDAIVDFRQFDTGDRHTQLTFGACLDAVCLDGEPFMPDGPPITPRALRDAIVKLHEKKTAAST